MSDSALRRQVAQLASELARTQAEVHTLRRGARRPQLGHSSIDSGSLDVVDSAGTVRLRLGWQPDGSVGVVPEGGDPHPAPATPVVEPIPSGLSVSWDGSLSGLDTLPADFDHVNVYVSIESGFTPSGVTFVGTITRSGGTLPVAPLEVGTTYYVRLVPVGTGGVQGAPSPQASGVPAPVGGVPGPGSITETEIADDAISTPKLQAEAVTALKIAAQAIEAGHIQAAAVTASKLEADLVLGTRIIAGTPGASRVEIDSDGLRGYDDDDALVFAIQDGDAVFTGTVAGSEITGSRITMGSGTVTGRIESAGDSVIQRVLSGPRQAQLFASDSIAELSARLDTEDPSSPAAALHTIDGQVGLTIDSSRLSADGMPSVTGVAWPDTAQLVLWSERNNSGAPMISFTATADFVAGAWRAGDGSGVGLRASGASASAAFTAPAASDPNDRQSPGYVFATRNATNDNAAISLQSPVWDEPGHPSYFLRSAVFAEGGLDGRPYTRIVQAARRVLVMGELTPDGYDTTSDGMLDLASTHSVYSPRHHPVQSTLSSQPGFGTAGAFVDFTSAQWAPITFRTSWSGWTRITVQTAGINHATGNASLATGFRVSGGSTVPASLTRSAYIRSRGSGVSEPVPATAVYYLQLAGNADCTLTPAWRINGGASSSSTASYYTVLDNTITVEPLT